ncbi:NAD(P)-binding domain-containing protein [uncultured Roseobacter sp.]|uniref:NAD(P)-binding domain-containing protein n=1 Tax=uncultured Roseobacter sp. TaxID=114847 RepID=UPI00260E71A0|nr:NAD(P)-binding domain-containing protein [uncultured Roseobacter sp.]
MSRIGFIGTGHIAAPMVRFLVGKGHQVTVSERNAGVAAALARSHGVPVAANQAVIDASDVVFLSVRPQIAEEVLAPLIFRAGQQIVSVMAGVSHARLTSLCAPADDISVTIPLGYLEQGGCPLPVWPDDHLLRTFFAPENPVFAVADERALNMHFAVCAMLPGILDLMATGAEWLTDQTGDAAQADFYAAQLIAGYLTAMTKEAGALARERDGLATEGTISIQMTRALRGGGAHVALRNAMAAIGDRLEGKS